jgi:tetratricopeptide (TPR) repeat protein
MSADSPPTIPGYQILHPLGRGGMASVYLAIQQSVDREVALKIMAPQLTVDPSFGERFLREARIAAKLHHRHVVSIYDVGVHDGIHYCAMEYLAGGPVMRRGAPPLALKPALRCVREIAQALHYAHSKGYIHRDVKPDNILLREDGSAVLSDFGIARAADSATMMTKTGSVVGTPHYMSPEQLRGRAIDGRADLYSLGVVFFQLLTGRVPYEASDSLAIGIMHMTAPLPVLPGDFQPLQAILEKMMAKEPADRFQTGMEIDQALAEVEKHLGDSGAETLPPKPRPTAATRRVDPVLRADRKPADTQGGVRTEPTIGHIEAVEPAAGTLVATPRPLHRTRIAPAPPAPAATGSASPAPAAAVPRRGTGRWIAIALVLALAGAGWWQREALRARIEPLLTGSPHASQLAVADAAIAEGRWLRADRADALAAYAAVLSLDPDNVRARAGLERVLDHLERELGDPASDPARIADLIDRLSSLPGTEARRARFTALLEQRRPKPGAAELERGRAAEAEQRLRGEQGALAAYAAALAADPNNARAQAGIARVAKRLAEQARALLAAGEFAEADAVAAELAAVEATRATAEDLQAAIAERRGADDRSARLRTLLEEGERRLRAGEAVEPRGQSAADRFQAALALDAGNARARSGLEQAIAQAIEQAEAALAEGKPAQARRLADRIRALAPRTPGLRALNERIEKAEIAARSLSPQQRAEHDRLLREGELALAAEQLVEPPGDSAYDKFRGALRIDPQSAAARAGLEAVAEALKTRIRSALADGRVSRADGDLEALRSVAPNDRQVAGLSMEVARGYAERGLRLVERGLVNEARQDLARAEQLAADEATVARLRAALVDR